MLEPKPKPIPIPDPGAPLPPIDLEVVNVGEDSISIRWRDNSTNETEFRAYLKKGWDTPIVKRVNSLSKTGKGREYTHTFNNLSRGAYQCWVTAFGDKGESFPSKKAGATIPATIPKVFGSEINQGITDYEAVAGKDTLVRVFVGAANVSMPARLDFASLKVTGPNGIEFTIEGRMSTGEFTNINQSYSETDNVNFYIPGSLLSCAGSYKFNANLFQDGRSVLNRSLGQKTFNATKDLRLLIVVDTWSMPVNAWNTLFRTLMYVSRNFPIRSGIGPLDGDRSLGLRFIIDPVPFDPDWPDWGPVRAKLTDFNNKQAANGKQDRADKIMTVRTQQPGEEPLGGVGEMGGNVSGVTLNLYPPGNSYFASVVCQEIGHNFGLEHSRNATIDTASAFDLLNHKAISSPRSIMFNPVVNSDYTFFLPEDWKTIREGLLRLDSTGPD